MILIKKLKTLCILVYIAFSFFNVKAQARKDSLSLQSSYIKGLGLVHQNPDSSIIILKSLIPEFSRLGWNRNYIFSNIGIYIAKRNLGDYEAAAYYLDELLPQALKLCGHYSEEYGTVANTYALHFFEIGAFEKAIEFSKIALSTFSYGNNEEQFPHDFGISLSNLAGIYLKSGNYSESIDYNLLAIKHKEKHFKKENIELTKGYQNTAMAYRAFGDYNESLKYFKIQRRYIKKYLKNNINKNLIKCNNSIAHTFLLKKDYDSTLYYIRINDSIQYKSNTNFFPQVKYDLLSQVYEKQNNLRKALESKVMMNQLRKEYYNFNLLHPKMADSYASLASLYIKLDSSTQALPYLDSALYVLTQGQDRSFANNYVYPVDAVPILQIKADCHAKRFQKNATQEDEVLAEKYYWLADSLVHQVKSGVQNEASKILFTKKIQPLYEAAISFFVSKGDQTNLEKAFIFSEKSKSALLQYGLQDTGAKLHAGVPDSLIQKERELNINISFYENLIFKEERKKETKNQEKINTWREILIQYEEDKKQLLKLLADSFPKYHQLKYQQHIPPIAEIQQKLRSGEQLLEFFYGEKNIYLFSISKNQFSSLTIPVTHKLSEALQQVFVYLQKPNHSLIAFNNYVEAGHFLYEAFVGKTITDHKPQCLIVIPDGKLALLNFEILLTNKFNSSTLNTSQKIQRAYRSLPYLLNQMSCRYAFSTSLLFSAETAIESSQNKLLAFAPSYTGNLHLNFTQPQVENISQILNGEALLGKKALKSHFLNYGNQYDILHFAAHGFPDTLSSLRAHILLFDSASSHQDSSKLYAFDIYNMNLKAKLVVLSACETGLGQYASGEGILSLNRAFRYAGSNAIISSLWKADGRSANAIMQAFYQKLDNGSSISTSLFKSKKEFLEKGPGDQMHPYFWGNFIVYGGDYIVSPNSYVWSILSISLAMLVFGILYWTRKKS